MPLFVLSIFNNASGDDYWFASLIKENGIIGGYQTFLAEENGRYISNLIIIFFNGFALKNDNYNLLFKILPAISITILFLSVIYFFIKSFLGKTPKIFHYALIVVAFYFLKTPAIHNYLYHVGSFTVYGLPNILILLFIMLSIKYHMYQKLKLIVLPMLCIYLIVGCNEAWAVNCLIITIFLLIMYYKKAPLRNFYLSILVIILFGFYLMFSARGYTSDLSRSATIADLSILTTLFKMTYYGVINIPYILSHYLLDISMVSFLLLALITFKKYGTQFGKFNINRLSVTISLLLFIILFSMPMIGNAVGLNRFGAALRTLDQMYFIFFMGVLFGTFILSTKISDKTISTIARYQKLIVTVMIVDLLFRSNFTHALWDIPYAYKHDKEVAGRYTYISEKAMAGEKVITVEPYKYAPQIVSGPAELYTDISHPFQKALVNFFGVDSLKLNGNRNWYFGPNPHYGHGHPHPYKQLNYNIQRNIFFLDTPFKIKRELSSE